MTKTCIFQENDISILEIFKSYNQSRKLQNTDSDTIYFSKVLTILSHPLNIFLFDISQMKIKTIDFVGITWMPILPNFLNRFFLYSYLKLGKLHQICTVSRLQHPIFKSKKMLHISWYVNATIVVHELLNCPDFLCC